MRELASWEERCEKKPQAQTLLKGSLLPKKPHKLYRTVYFCNFLSGFLHGYKVKYLEVNPYALHADIELHKVFICLSFAHAVYLLLQYILGFFLYFLINTVVAAKLHQKYTLICWRIKKWACFIYARLYSYFPCCSSELCYVNSSLCTIKQCL